MKNKQIKYAFFFLFLLAGITYLLGRQCAFDINIKYRVDDEATIQIFTLGEDDLFFTETQSHSVQISPQRSLTKVNLKNKDLVSFRLDFDGTQKLIIEDMEVSFWGISMCEINTQNYNNYLVLRNDCSINMVDDEFYLISEGSDSYIIFDIDDMHIPQWGYAVILLASIILTILFLTIIVCYKYHEDKVKTLFFTKVPYIKNHMLLVRMSNVFRNQIMCLSILTFIWGMMFTFLIPPWQTPDEYNHLEMIGQGIKNDYLAKNLLNEMPLDCEKIRFHPEEKIDHEQIKEVMKKSPSYSVIECMPKGIDKEIVSHFPATIGILIGVFLRMPAYWVVILGKIFSLLFYIGINVITLKLVPQKRELFEVVMLLPMCIQQAASLSYDAVLLPMSFLLIAYVLHLKYVVARVGMREVGALFGILACIGLAKIPYVLLGGVVLIIPIQKLQISVGKWEITEELIKKRWQLICISIITIIAIGTYCLRGNTWVRLVCASIRQFPRTLYLYRMTLKNFAEHLIVSSIGNFGYLDTPTALWFVCIATGFIFIVSITYIRHAGKDSYTRTELENRLWSVKDRIILYLVWLVCAYVVTLSMVSHTFKMTLYGTESINIWIDWNEALYQIPYVGGLQGRYYIPILLLILLPMPKLLETERKIYRASFFIFYVLAGIYTCSVIYARFW